MTPRPRRPIGGKRRRKTPCDALRLLKIRLETSGRSPLQWWQLCRGDVEPARPDGRVRTPRAFTARRTHPTTMAGPCAGATFYQSPVRFFERKDRPTDGIPPGRAISGRPLIGGIN
jgi:hypothetical protein